MNETKITSKGTTTIPQEIREKLNILPGSVLAWVVEKGAAVARPVTGKGRSKLNAMQQHIDARAGSWNGIVSGEELLKRTRGQQ